MRLSKTFLKLHQFVYISHEISLRQAKLWNILLANSSDSIATRNQFHISVKEILFYLNARKTDFSRISDSLLDLVVDVEFNIFERDENKKWGTFPLIESIEIGERFCTYSYDTELQRRLCEGGNFVEIDLMLQKVFRSKYSLFLYELLLTYKARGVTHWIDVDDFKKFMGIKRESYSKFKYLNQFVIKGVVNDINEKTDFFIESQLGVLLGKISCVRFWIDEKKHRLTRSEFFVLDDNGGLIEEQG